MKAPLACLIALAACAAASCAVVSAQETSAQKEPIRYRDVEKLCELQETAINESSGIAVSRRNDGVFWTHNDSGDSPRLFAFDASGRGLATVYLTGAQALDWEDMASFTVGKKHYLLVGDFGDNYKLRGSYQLYIIEEPLVPPPGKHPRPKSCKVEVKISFSWRGGAQNCEAVAVDTKGKTIYLATREESAHRSRVFTLPLPTRSPKGLQVAEPLVDLPHRKVTGMDMSPDGRRAVVVTYTTGFIYKRGKDETWKAAFAREPQRLKLPRRKQGEAVCYGVAGRSIYLTSEQRPAPVHVFRAKPKPSD